MDKINKVVSEEVFFNAYNKLLENNEKNKCECQRRKHKFDGRENIIALGREIYF